MARIKLTEYRAKKILIGNSYQGISVREKTRLPKSGRFVVKVDEGIKKRFKLGLVALDQPAAKIGTYLSSWKKKGFSQFLLEPFVPHEESEERYLSLERARDGIRVLYAREGGIDIEAHPEKIVRETITAETNITTLAKKLSLPESFLTSLVRKFEEHFFAFLEINPLVVKGNEVFILDAAVLVDSAAEFFVQTWKPEDLVESASHIEAEENVRALAATSPSSFKLNVLNPNGSLFFLLSGGGGSIVIADEAAAQGLGKEIANYGEYSGGPTQEETYLYTKEVVRLVLASNAKKKALIIAGGVANFTDVETTFAGIIDALQEVAPKLRKNAVKVFVRRGGPNEESGLAHMKAFLEKEQLLGSIYGSEAPITAAITEASAYVSK